MSRLFPQWPFLEAKIDIYKLVITSMLFIIEVISNLRYSSSANPDIVESEYVVKPTCANMRIIWKPKQ